MIDINNSNSESVFINTREVSRITGIPVATLVTWRSRKSDGPPFYIPKGTRRVLYEQTEVIDWVKEDGQRRSTADQVIKRDSDKLSKCNDLHPPRKDQKRGRT